LFPLLKNIDSSKHGISHWRSVDKIGKRLSERNDADYSVIEYFAYLHDSQRLDEDKDIEHGYRAKVFVQSLLNEGKLSDLTPKQQNQLLYACEYHSHDFVRSNDITILTCIDSDRLDLTRFGIQPD